MTARSAHEARIHLISEGVIASYIHDIATSTAGGVPAAPIAVAGEESRIR